MITIWPQHHRNFIVRIHRVYCPQTLAPEQQLTLDGKTAHYLGRVLRVEPGQSIVLFNGDGRDYLSEVLQVGKKDLQLVVRSRLPAVCESSLSVTVVQAISRGERMDQTLQKCTELGAAAFQPLFSERVEVRLRGDKLARRLEHWRSVVISACEQSGRARVPAVHRPVQLAEWIRAESQSRRLVLAPRAETPLSRVAITQAVEVAVGPEGGFSSTEMEQLVAGGVNAAGLGPRILRTETAAPAAMAVLQAMKGDF
jgi:16S rRNA (uracil1498-N3)-methyltransferase